jgi:hypothetical protein
MLSLAGIFRSAIWIVPVSVGQPVETASGTAAVAAEVNWVEPSAFVATTETRNVRPAAASFNVYVAPVAPSIVAQLLPSAAQRLHVNAKLVGLPSQLPWLAVSVEPAWRVPEMPGAVVFVGAAALETTAEGAEVT